MEAPDRDLADHPGRPRGRDELDPELLVLPRPRAAVGPLLALSVLVFCVYFLVRLRNDLVFAHAGDDPAQVKDVAGVLAADLDSYVELTAIPDRAAVLRVYTSDATDGHRLAPVLGSGERLWILFAGNQWAEPPTYDERVRGRVKQLDDLPFADALRDELARTPLPRALDVPAALAALGARSPSARTAGAEVRDLAGDPVALSPDTPVTVVERAAGEVRVVAIATDGQKDEAAWRAALEAAGVLAPGGALESKTDATWSFRAAAPDGIDAVAARLVAAKLFAARAEPIDRTVRIAWRDLAVQGDALLVSDGGQRSRVIAASVTAILAHAPRRAPADARVLVATDRPADYWHVTAVYAVLFVLALAFAWALWRGVRAARAAAPAPALKEEAQP